MKDSTDLFDLIKSMSKAEKAYFKKYGYKSTSSSENNVYLEAFNLLDRQKTYDPEALQAFLKKKKLAKKMAYVKNYLHTLILNSLRQYHETHDHKLTIQNLLAEMRILLDKGLKNQARKRQQRALKLAMKHENYLAVLEALEYEERFIPVDKHEFIQKENAYLNRKKYLEILLNQYELAWLRRKMHLMIYSKIGGDVRGKRDYSSLKSILKHPLLKDENQAISFEAKYCYYSLMGYYYRAINDLKTSQIFRKKAADMFEGKDHLKITFERLYLGALFNVLVAASIEKDIETFHTYMQRFWQFKALRGNQVSLHIATYMFSFYGIELEFNNMIGDFGLTVKEFEKILPELKMYEKELNERKWTGMYFSATVAYVVTGDYNKALDLINILINADESQYANRNRYIVIQLLRLICHFELENFNLLEAFAQSTYRYLNKLEKPFLFETAILKFLKKKISYRNLEELKTGLIDLKKDLLELVDNPEENAALNYFDFIKWLDSKIEGRPMIQLYPEANRQA